MEFNLCPATIALSGMAHAHGITIEARQEMWWVGCDPRSDGAAIGC
jgi:hypothetical protein